MEFLINVILSRKQRRFLRILKKSIFQNLRKHMKIIGLNVKSKTISYMNFGTENFVKNILMHQIKYLNSVIIKHMTSVIVVDMMKLQIV